MAITIYCKTCGKDVPAEEVCASCGTPLKATGRRVVWSMVHHPVADWLKWNEVARILLPAYGVLAGGVVLLDALSGGSPAVEKLLTGGFPLGVLLVLLLTMAVTAAVLFLQGKDVVDVEVDSKGIHQRVYLPRPTPLKLLMRLKPASLLQQGGQIILVSQTDVPWRDVARVQLWPEKTTVLLYSPFWLLRLGVRCDPFQYEDVLTLIREKMGKKRAVMLPPMLRQSPPPRKTRTAAAPHPHGMEDLPLPMESPQTDLPEELPY